MFTLRLSIKKISVINKRETVMHSLGLNLKNVFNWMNGDFIEISKLEYTI